MKFLVIGLGSMGKRRVRCLKKIGFEAITGYDIKKERMPQTRNDYGIDTIDYLDSSILKDFDVLIISSPPDQHNQYIKLAIENKKHAFVEAGIILEGLEQLNTTAKEKKVQIIPSCTMKFHPAIKEIRKIVSEGRYGKLTNFSYHCGLYLPDWHPWENYKEFYASRRNTGGAREMVAFELKWIVDITGFPRNISGYYGKTLDMDVDIDDTYVIAIDSERIFGSMTIDVVSRYSTRSLILNLQDAQILWRWEENVVRLYDAKEKKWIYLNLPEGEHIEGYDKNITEDMYVDETRQFIETIKGENTFPFSLDEEIKILKLVYKLEGKNE